MFWYNIAKMEYFIPKEIVTLCTVTTAGTCKAVVTILVDKLVTVGTVELSIENWNSEPALNHCSVQLWVHMGS